MESNTVYQKLYEYTAKNITKLEVLGKTSDIDIAKYMLSENVITQEEYDTIVNNSAYESSFMKTNNNTVFMNNSDTTFNKTKISVFTNNDSIQTKNLYMSNSNQKDSDNISFVEIVKCLTKGDFKKLFELLGAALFTGLGKLDSAVGLDKVREFLKKYGIGNLNKYVDDGNDKNLSKLEACVAMLEGMQDAILEMISAQGLLAVATLGGAGKLAKVKGVLGQIGKIFNAVISGTFTIDGALNEIEGIPELIKAFKNNDKNGVKVATQKVFIGLLELAGGLISLKKTNKPSETTSRGKGASSKKTRSSGKLKDTASPEKTQSPSRDTKTPSVNGAKKTTSPNSSNKPVKQAPSFREYSDNELNEIFGSIEHLSGIKKQMRLQEMIDRYYYEELRNSGHYTKAESINGRFEDILPNNYNPSEGVTIIKSDWIWHEFNNGCKHLGVDRISLSVKADRRMLEELDQLLLNGKYKDKNGNIVTIPRDKFTKGFYKTDIFEESWCTRHDPVTIYFDEKISQEMLNAIAEITEKYQRVPERELIGAVEGKPWIAHETAITPEQVKSLVAEAQKVDADLAYAIENYLGEEPSTGMYNSCVKMIKDYKRYKSIAPKKPMNTQYSEKSIEQSRNFNKTNKIEAGEKIQDGYKDGGRELEFDMNGNIIKEPYREIILVDRAKDVKLQSFISEIKRETANMNEKEKANFLLDYVNKICGELNGRAEEAWENSNIGRELLLGDIVTQRPGVASCRHKSLLLKILGDEIGLNVELQRGNFNRGYTAGRHAWNIIKFSDGSSAIFDAMHNKISSTTPGKIGSYSKYYETVDGKPLYGDGNTKSFVNTENIIDNNPAQTPEEIINKRFNIRSYLEKNFSYEFKRVEDKLGDNSYRIKWEEIIPDNSTLEDDRMILIELYNQI